METKTEQISINEWITPEQRRFSYKLYWPFSDIFNPDQTIVDINVKLKEDTKTYIGTFLTLEELASWFDRFAQNGEYANGTYIPFGEKNKEFLLKRISHSAIETTLTDLLEKDEFLNYFEKVNE